jgi:predicted peptidase
MLFAFCCVTQLTFAQFETGFIDLGRDSMHYLIAYPDGYEEAGATPAKWPLVLFLHGGGEGGNNLELVKKNGIPKHVAAGDKFPFILLVPQNKFQRGFWDVVGLHHLLDELLKNPKIDPDRVYLTGLSRGGLGAWMTAMHDPGRFAALAPVCGAVPASYDIWVPENLPIWVFHGTDDDLIHPSESVNMVENLRRKKMNPMPKLTLYEGVGHNSWERAYADPALYEWMLRQRRPEKQK